MNGRPSMNFSLQAPPQATPPRPEAAELPPAGRPTRRRKGGRGVVMLFAALVVVGGVVVAGMFPGVQKSFAGLFKPSGAQIFRHKVTKGILPVTVVERGNLESAQNKDVLNEVEGQTTIIKILPEGTLVK